jgi:hypothetical protein
MSGSAFLTGGDFGTRAVDVPHFQQAMASSGRLVWHF